jgi:hypothetical protein
MNDSWPRVLILSDEGPQTGTAGGLLLHRLFRNCPPERLRVIARHVPAIGEPLPGVAYRRLLPPWHRFEGSRFHRLKRSLRAWGLVPPAPLARLEALLEGFAPEVVCCVMQHAQYYDTAHRFARLRGLPLVDLAQRTSNRQGQQVEGRRVGTRKLCETLHPLYLRASGPTETDTCTQRESAS